MMRSDFFLILLLLFMPGIPLSAQPDIPSWTHFRGDRLDGTATGEGYPLTWNDTVNIAWKAPVPGEGWSSPVVLGKQVWITYALPENRELWARKIWLESGETELDLLVFRPDTLRRKHSVNTYATPTPALEKDRVYIHFGRYGTACFDAATGKRIWERTDLECEHIQGPGSSLLIYKDKLIVHLEGTDKQIIAALDKHTGKTVWLTERPQALYDPLEPIGKKAYITPLIIRVAGRDLLISNGSAVCIAYDPETGKEVWRVVQGEDSTIAMPAWDEVRVFFYTGFVTGESGKKYAELLAVDPRGAGDVTRSHVVWRKESPILQLPTPLAVNGRLYTVDSRATLWCLESSTGREVWSRKLKGKFHASPVYAGGHIYCFSTRGETLVFREGPDPGPFTENRLEGNLWATPAFTGGMILLRTSRYLYCIDGPGNCPVY